MAETQTPIEAEAYSPRIEHGDLSAMFDFNFKKFASLTLIKLLFPLGILVFGLMWLMMVFSGFRNGVVAGLASIVFATVMSIFNVLLFRVVLEMIAVSFRICDNTARLVELQSPAVTTTTITPNEA